MMQEQTTRSVQATEHSASTAPQMATSTFDTPTGSGDMPYTTGQGAYSTPRSRNGGQRAEDEAGQGNDDTPRYSRAELQRELDRVAKKERERGRRQALKDRQAEVHVPGSESEATAQSAEHDAVGSETGDEGRQAQADATDPADLLDTEQQRMLGHAMADKTIQEGDEAVQRGIEELLLKEERLTAREDETLFWLFNHASLKACEEELTKQGVDGAQILRDKDFIAFAEMMRGDVPLVKVYEQYARTRGVKEKPVSTGSVQGQGPAGAPYFSQEQVKRMTRGQVRKHYNDIEKSRRFWK